MGKKNDSSHSAVLSALGISMTIAVLIAAFTSCKQIEYVTVPEVHTDTLIINKVQRDSVYLHDSISVKEKGDTVLIEKWHTKIKNVECHDTLYVSRTDSVPVPYEVVKEVKVEKELNWLQKTLMTIGGAILLGFIGYILFKFVLKRFV